MVCKAVSSALTPEGRPRPRDMMPHHASKTGNHRPAALLAIARGELPASGGGGGRPRADRRGGRNSLGGRDGGRERGNSAGHRTGRFPVRSRLDDGRAGRRRRRPEAGGRDAFVRRYRADGEVVWTRQFGAAGDDNADDLSVDAVGNVYVAARVDGPVGNNSSPGGRDAYVAMYDPDGAELWSLQFGTPGVDWADAVTVGPGGDVFVSGSAAAAFPGFTNLGGTDNFLARISPDGELIAVSQFGSSEGMSATALATSDELVVLAGSAFGPLSEQPLTDEHAGSSDLFLRAFNLEGEAVWTRMFGSNHADSALDLSVAGNGGLVVVGATRATLPNPAVGIGERVGGFEDAFVMRYGPDGEVEWVRQFGTDEWDVATSLTVGADGVLYVAGRTNGESQTFSGRGEFDVFVSAFSADGQALWTHQMGSAAEDFAYAVAVGPSESLFVAGSGGLVGGRGRGSGDERGWVIRMAFPAE
jgi:hypothetical protein